MVAMGRTDPVASVRSPALHSPFHSVTFSVRRFCTLLLIVLLAGTARSTTATLPQQRATCAHSAPPTRTSCRRWKVRPLSLSGAIGLELGNRNTFSD